MEKLGAQIGKKIRDEVTHFIWIDLTQNNFLYDVQANTAIIAGFKKQKDLQYAGLSTQGIQSDQMARLLVAKKGALTLNMRNSNIAQSAITYLS